MDYGEQTQPIAANIGERSGNDLGAAEPRKFVQNEQHGLLFTIVGQLPRVEVDQLLEKQIVERRDPIEFIRRDTEIDRGRDAAKVRQGKVAFGRRAIDNRIDPEIELGGEDRKSTRLNSSQ